MENINPKTIFNGSGFTDNKNRNVIAKIIFTIKPKVGVYMDKEVSKLIHPVSMNNF